MNSWDRLFEKLQIRMHDEKLLREAFTHRSAVNEASVDSHNERLEFLGDAVLELVSTEFLFRKFPKLPEGVLTSYRSALVKGEHLATVARRLDLGKHFILSKGERRSGGADKDYLLANLTEAVIGAIYIEKGFEITKAFIHREVLCDLDMILAKGEHIDAKSNFQELAQGKCGITPHYEVLEESGLDHEKHFVVGAFLDEKQVGIGEGGSKKEAQVSAAEKALKNKKQWLGEESHPELEA